MKGNCGTSWRRSGRGTTLVEVTAGLAVMGALLVSVLIATSRLKAQSARSAMRADACEVADGLLAGWWPKPDQLPRDAEGVVIGPGGQSWRWRTRRVRRADADAKNLSAEVIAIEVFAADIGGEDRDEQPAARVEIVLAEEGYADPTTQPAPAGGPDAD